MRNLIPIAALGIASAYALLCLSQIPYGLAQTVSPPVLNERKSGDSETSNTLSDNLRKALDIQFFNEFWVKSEFPTEERVDKIRKMAAQGFEVADLASRLYAFDRGGIPRFGTNYLADWNRLLALAASGDSSAQCLFVQVAKEFTSFNLNPPTKADVDVLLPRYRDAAIKSMHPYCWWILGRNKDRKDEGPLTLQCAYQGATFCQVSLATLYRQGDMFPKNVARGLCWLIRAHEKNAALSLKNWLSTYKSFVEDEIGARELDLVLKETSRGTDCEELARN